MSGGAAQLGIGKTIPNIDFEHCCTVNTAIRPVCHKVMMVNGFVWCAHS